MKKPYLLRESLKFFCIVLIVFSCTNGLAQQNQYIDLSPSQLVVNPLAKQGWNLVFNDEFSGTKNNMWRNGYCSGTIGPDNDPFYYIDAAYSFDTSTISLNLKREWFDFLIFVSLIWR